MIPKSVRPGATGENLGDGEIRAFTISANGTAFRTLIDGLYSNKVRAVVRELCSNAWDSHVDAKQTRPIKVSIPTTLDPTFRVRDFGTSLSHEDMMVLYTTIFQSTKTGTNEQTGQLGLGSKSPFAYTDSFSVTAFMDGERRGYLAYLATDGVPSLKYMGSVPSDEPRGLEVSFAAKREDIGSFQREMQFVAMGYTVTPEVEGMAITIKPARLRGSNWAIYPRGSFGENVRENHYIRQGSALYPSNREFPHVGYGWITITEIPIGTASVAASREALSYDGDTTRAVQTVQANAYTELRTQIDALLAKAVTRVEKARVYHEYNGILTNLRGDARVGLWRDERDQKIDKYPGDRLEEAAHFGKSQTTRGLYDRYRSMFEVSELDKFVLLVNDEETKIVRRTRRIRKFNETHSGTVMVLDQPNDVEFFIDGSRKYANDNRTSRAMGIAWVKECLSLRPDQIINVSSLPDCPPVKSGNPRPKAAIRVLAPGQYWMIRESGRVLSDIYGNTDHRSGRRRRSLPQEMNEAIKFSKFNAPSWDEVFWVTLRQQEKFVKRGQLPDNMRLDKAVQTALANMVATLPLDDALTYQSVNNNVGSWNKSFPVVLANFFPMLKITDEQASNAVKMAKLAKIELHNLPIVATVDKKIRELISQYPLLFQRSDRSHYEHYVAAVKAAAEREEVNS